MSQYSCPDDKTIIAPLRKQITEDKHGSVILETADGRSFSVIDKDVVGRTSIGRDILESYVEVSRKHAQFFCREDVWFVVDLNSSNGIYLDKQKIAPNHPTPLADGQRIELSCKLGFTAKIIKGAPAAITIVAEPEDPNRRTLIILFADIKGSVDFFQEQGTVVAKNWIFKLFRMLTEIIEEHDGSHLKNIGDAILAIFNDPHAAVLAALKMQRIIREHNLVVDVSERYYLRIGMNMGSVLFENNDVFGNTVNIASRVQSFAPPEKIYVTGNLSGKIEKSLQFQVRFVGNKELKGVKSATEIYEIISAEHSEVESLPPSFG